MRNTTQHNALRAATGIAAAALVATPITLSLSPQDNQPAATHTAHTPRPHRRHRPRQT